jgi:cobalt/nickel transport system permease protein
MGTAGVSDTAVRNTASRALRPLWAALGALLILTPFGILATGSAWGEWMASDFANPPARAAIAAASLRAAAPAQAPAGLARLSSIWTAPFARYAPPFIRSEAFGYMLSAMFGVGLVLLLSLFFVRFLRRGEPLS